MYVYIYIYIYTYICLYILSGPWKLFGRFRYVSAIRVCVSFPLRFRYVPINVSVTFPSRFRRVSVRVSVALPLGRCLPDGNHQKTLANICVLLNPSGRANPHPKSALAQWFRPRLATCCLGFDPRGQRCRKALRRRPGGRTDSRVSQRFRGVSINACAKFPARFRQGFRCVSVGRKLTRNSPNFSGAH